MSEPHVRVTDDPEQALTESGAFLKRNPVAHTTILTLLDERVRLAEPGRYWSVWDGGDVVGFAMQSPRGKPLLLTVMPRHAVETLAVTLAAEQELSLPAVTAEAGTAAAFAGCWSELVPGHVDTGEGQRLYRLGELSLAGGVPGGLRHVRDEERALVTEWAREFRAETGAVVAEPGELVSREMAGGRLFVWDVGGAVCMARATTVIAGVSRIGFVYTPVELRGRGYALACVGALSGRVRDVTGADCVLFTQLSNPTSNRIYRRLGYEAVTEILTYDFHPHRHEHPANLGGQLGSSPAPPRHARGGCETTGCTGVG